jgi:hypothetical protein
MTTAAASTAQSLSVDSGSFGWATAAAPAAGVLSGTFVVDRTALPPLKLTPTIMSSTATITNTLPPTRNAPASVPLTVAATAAVPKIGAEQSLRQSSLIHTIKAPVLRPVPKVVASKQPTIPATVQQIHASAQKSKQTAAVRLPVVQSVGVQSVAVQSSAVRSPVAIHESSSDDSNNETTNLDGSVADSVDSNLAEDDERRKAKHGKEDGLTTSTGTLFNQSQQIQPQKQPQKQFVGVATTGEVARAGALGRIVPPSELVPNSGNSDLMFGSSSVHGSYLFADQLVNSTLTPSSAPQLLSSGAKNPSSDDKIGSGTALSASHALFVSLPSENKDKSGGGAAITATHSGLTHSGFVTPPSSGSFGSPLSCVSGSQEPLRHLDLVGDPRILVNFLVHWINRECHWQSPGHARCVRARLERIAAYAKKEQQNVLDKMARDNAPTAELARQAALFGESQRTAQSLLSVLAQDGNSNSSAAAAVGQRNLGLKRVQAVLLDFPYAVGPQYLARYLLAQPDWNAMADDYKNIILQSDFESIEDGELTSPDRMIAYMSRSSVRNRSK